MQRSSRCAAALIITSCASVSLTLMIQPFLSSRRPGQPSPAPGRAPDRPKPKGRRLGHPRIMRAPSDDDTMLHAERKASPFCAGRAIVVNGSEESAGPMLPANPLPPSGWVASEGPACGATRPSMYAGAEAWRWASAAARVFRRSGHSRTDASFSRGGCPGALRSTRLSGPCALNLSTQSRTTCNPTPPIFAASVRVAPS